MSLISKTVVTDIIYRGYCNGSTYNRQNMWFSSRFSLQKGGGAYYFWDGSRWRWSKTSCLLCTLITLWNILMIFGRNVDQEEMTCRIQNRQLWLSYFWSYHPLFYLKKVSCPLCNSNTVWNISMVLGRNVEQDQTTWRIQELQLCLSYFWRYLPLLYLTVITHWFRVCSVSQRPFGIVLWYFVKM